MSTLLPGSILIGIEFIGSCHSYAERRERVQDAIVSESVTKLIVRQPVPKITDEKPT